MLPGGKVDKESDIVRAAQRELQEETGFRSDDLRYYCSSNNWEIVSSTNHFFVARSLVEDRLPQDATELIEVHAMPLEEAIERVLSCEHTHTPSAYALLRYKRDHT
jgi:ADP-ribose pyrophosphatase